MNLGDRRIKFHLITSHQVNAHIAAIQIQRFTSCTFSRSSNKMQRRLLATSCEKWYQHFNGSYTHACLDSQVHHTFQDAPPHHPMSSKKHLRCFIFKRKTVGGHDPHQLQDDNVRLRPLFFWSFFVSPSLPEHKRLHISKKAGYIFYIILHICLYILYHWVLKSARFGGGITAWSFRGEFFGCKAWSFPQ